MENSLKTVQESEFVLRKILSVKDNGMSYPINRNLHRIKTALKPLQEEAKEFDEIHYIKNSNGEKIEYLAQVIEGQIYFKRTEDGKFIEKDFSRELAPNELWMPRIDPENKEYNDGVKDLNSKKVEIDWYQFNSDEFSKVKNKFDGIDYTVLFDTGVINIEEIV